MPVSQLKSQSQYRLPQPNRQSAEFSFLHSLHIHNLSCNKVQHQKQLLKKSDTKPEAIHDFYHNDELINLTKELTETLRKSKTVDWQKKKSARARMRMIVKKLLKKYKYPPEGMEDALQTVMVQCELWTDNVEYNQYD